jgi:multidrug resistance protein, MATE family
MAIPVIFSQIGQVTVNVVDNIMVGHLGTTELAAASFSLNVFNIGMLFGMGFTIGITPLVGQSFNVHSTKTISAWFRNGLSVNFVGSLFLAAIMGSLVLVMAHMGQSADVVEKAIPFYLLHVCSLIPLMLFFSFKQFFEGIGNTKVSMMITIFINVLNIVLNYLLIYGKLGLPKMGLYGSGTATLIARMIMPVLFLFFILKTDKYKKYLVEAIHSHVERSKMKRIIQIGFSIGLQVVIEVLSFNIGAIMLGWISKESLAGHQVAMSMASMTYMISFGLASGTTIRVSHAFGQHDLPEVKRTILASLHLVVAFMGTMGVLFIVLRHYIPLLFTTDPAVIKVAATLLVVGALFQIFDGLQVVLLGALRGLADVKAPMVLAFISYIVVSLPTSYLAAFVLKLGPSGVWTGFVCGLSTAAFLFALRLRKCLKNKSLALA